MIMLFALLPQQRARPRPGLAMSARERWMGSPASRSRSGRSAVVSCRDPARTPLRSSGGQAPVAGAGKHAESQQARGTHDDAVQKQLPADRLLS
jgi:hypothetical protein